MRIGWVRVQAALLGGVLASGVGAALATGGSGVTLAGPQVLRLIQNAQSALSTYPALTLTMHVDISGPGRSISFTEHGLSSPDGKLGSITVKLPGGMGTLHQIMADGSLYAPAVAGHFPATAGKHWIGLKVLTASARNDDITGQDPTGYLSMLPGATGPVQVVGHDHVDGVATTHYRVTIDLTKMLQSLPSRLQQPDTVAGIQQYGITTLPFDVWFDADNALRRVRTTVHLDQVTATVTMDLAGSRRPVQISVPKPSDTLFVTDVTQFETLALGRP